MGDSLGIARVRVAAAVIALCVLTALYSIVSRNVLLSLEEQPTSIIFSLLAGTVVQGFVVAFLYFGLLCRSGATRLHQVQLFSANVWLLALVEYATVLLTFASFSYAPLAAAVSMRATEPVVPVLLVAVLRYRARASEQPWWALASTAVLLTGSLLSFFAVIENGFCSSGIVLLLLMCTNAGRNVQSALPDGDDAAEFAKRAASFVIGLCVSFVFSLAAPSWSIAYILQAGSNIPWHVFMWAVAGVALAAHSALLASLATWYGHSLSLMLVAAHYVLCFIAACIFVPDAADYRIAMLCFGIIFMVAGFALQYVGVSHVRFESTISAGEAKTRGRGGLSMIDVGVIVVGIVAAVFWIILSALGPVLSPPSYDPVPLPSSPPPQVYLALSCFDFPGNLGDTGVHRACEGIFAEVAAEEGYNVTFIDKTSATNDTVMVYGGGSLLGADWAQNIWYSIVRSLNPHHWRYPIFLFGSGYDDNAVSWTSNSTVLDSVLSEAVEVSAGDGMRDVHMSSFNTSLSLPQQSCPNRLYWPIIMPNLLYGGVRGPLSARILATLASESYITLPVVSRVVGDSGAFVGRYSNAQLDLVDELGVRNKTFVLVLVGKASDGTFLIGANQTHAQVVEQEEVALRGFAIHAVKAGYDVVFARMESPPADRELVASLYNDTRAGVNETLHDNVKSYLPVPTLESLLGLIKSAHVVVAHKLHGGVFAGAYGVPFISIAYRLKHYDWAISLNAPDLVVRISDVSEAGLIERFDYINLEYGSICEHLLLSSSAIFEKYKEEARRFLKAAAEIYLGG